MPPMFLDKVSLCSLGWQSSCLTLSTAGIIDVHPANCSHLCTTIVSLKTKQHKNKEKTYFGYSRSPPADDF